MTTTIDNFITKTVGQFFGRNTPSHQPGKKLGEYALLKSYQTIFERNKLKKPIATQKEIRYSSAVGFGSSPNSCINQMTNKPIEVLFNTHNLNRHILLFTEKVEGHLIQIEMHFHQDALFHFKIAFPEADKDFRIKLIKQLIATYKLADLDLTLHSIYDHQNHCIQVRDFNCFTIEYTALNSAFFSNLIKEVAKTSNQLLVDYHLTSAPIINK